MVLWNAALYSNTCMPALGFFQLTSNDLHFSCMVVFLMLEDTYRSVLSKYLHYFEKRRDFELALVISPHMKECSVVFAVYPGPLSRGYDSSYFDKSLVKHANMSWKEE